MVPHPSLSDALLRGLPVGEAELEGLLVLFGMRGKPVIRREAMLAGICRGGYGSLGWFRNVLLLAHGLHEHGLAPLAGDLLGLDIL